MVGQRDVIAPHVKLPLAQAKDAAQDVAGVDADSHVHVEAGRFADEPAGRRRRRKAEGVRDDPNKQKGKGLSSSSENGIIEFESPLKVVLTSLCSDR